MILFFSISSILLKLIRFIFVEFQRVVIKTMITLAFCMILELKTVVLINSGCFFNYLTEFEFQEMESESFQI